VVPQAKKVTILNHSRIDQVAIRFDLQNSIGVEMPGLQVPGFPVETEANAAVLDFEVVRLFATVRFRLQL